jgi:hypothetical protein
MVVEIDGPGLSRYIKTPAFMDSLTLFVTPLAVLVVEFLNGWNRDIPGDSGVVGNLLVMLPRRPVRVAKK